VAGLFASGRVATTTHPGIVAPLTAIDQRGLKPTVTRLKSGKTEVVQVALGTRDDANENVEITTGVTAGDTLLVGAAAGITPGTPVRVSAGSDKAAPAVQAAPLKSDAKKAEPAKADPAKKKI
jgi:hypothetical protein